MKCVPDSREQPSFKVNLRDTKWSTTTNSKRSWQINVSHFAVYMNVSYIAVHGVIRIDAKVLFTVLFVPMLHTLFAIIHYVYMYDCMLILDLKV